MIKKKILAYSPEQIVENVAEQVIMNPLSTLQLGVAFRVGFENLKIFGWRSFSISELDPSTLVPWFKGLEKNFQTFGKMALNLVQLSTGLGVRLERDTEFVEGVYSPTERVEVSREEFEFCSMLPFQYMLKGGLPWHTYFQTSINQWQINYFSNFILPPIIPVLHSAQDPEIKEHGNKFIINLCRYLWKRESETNEILAPYKESLLKLLYGVLAAYFDILNFKQASNTNADSVIDVGREMIDSGSLLFEIDGFNKEFKPAQLYCLLSTMYYQLYTQPKTEENRLLAIKLQAEMELTVNSSPKDNQLRFSVGVDSLTRLESQKKYEEAVATAEESLRYLSTMENCPSLQKHYLVLSISSTLIRCRLSLMSNKNRCAVKVSSDWQVVVDAYQKEIKANPYRFEHLSVMYIDVFIGLVETLVPPKQGLYIKEKLLDMGNSLERALPRNSEFTYSDSLRLKLLRFQEKITFLSPNQDEASVSEEERLKIERELIEEEEAERKQMEALLKPKPKPKKEVMLKRKSPPVSTKEIEVPRDLELVSKPCDFEVFLKSISERPLSEKIEEMRKFEKSYLKKARQTGDLTNEDRVSLAYCKSELAHCSLMKILEGELDLAKIKTNHLDFVYACGLAKESLAWIKKEGVSSEIQMQIKEGISITIEFVKAAVRKIEAGYKRRHERYLEEQRQMLGSYKKQKEDILAKWKAFKESPAYKKGNREHPSKQSVDRQRRLAILDSLITEFEGNSKVAYKTAFLTKACREIRTLEEALVAS